jgi:hypothetical protein
LGAGLTFSDEAGSDEAGGHGEFGEVGQVEVAEGEMEFPLEGRERKAVGRGGADRGLLDEATQGFALFGG